MKITDLKIGTQLRLGLVVILLLVLGLGALARWQTERLWQQADTMYNHPLQTRRALGELQADILAMHRAMKDLVLAVNEPEVAAALQEDEIRSANAVRQLEILAGAYLGPRGDLNALQDEFAKWKAIRAETIRLFRAGKTAEAVARTKTGGAGGAQVAVLTGFFKKIDEFARNKGDQLYRDATALNENLNRQLVVIVAAIMALSLLVSYILLRAIKEPLRRLSVATDQFRQGKMDVRCGQIAANEFGELAASFNAMADAIQTEVRINAAAAELAGVMLREEEVRDFCRELLKGLLEHTGSQVGAVYFLNDAKSAYEHFESIGLGACARTAFAATELEGELGAAVATRRIQRITDIPANTRFALNAVGGEFSPREILTIPVLADHTVTAVFSLASVHAYDAASLRLVEEIWSVLTARVNGVLAFRTIKDLAENLEHQNCELDAQKRELAEQASELTEQNAELEMQKTQLGEASRLKSAFLSKMSHELRTPLNSVIALAGVLNRRLEGKIPGEQHGYLEVIERNGRHLLSLINDILDLSRVEAGWEDVSLARFSLPALVAEVVAMIEPQAREKNIALDNLVLDDLPTIASDTEKCRHILQNLVANAVKFTDAGSVTVSARCHGEEIFIAVSDTGIGIAADQLPHIFEEFRQADDSASRRFGGTGLGLAIADRYATLLHGGIKVESAPGKGSTFTLRLPLALEASEVARAVGVGRPATRSDNGVLAALSGAGRTILVVEDSEPAMIQLTDILAGQGYRIRVARNGHEALAQIELILPDAIILDLMMPEVDGFQVLKAIRGVERTALLPVLILTAKHVTKEELSFLKGNNIHQLIQKGDVSRTQLLAAVARMVAPRREEHATAPPPEPRRRRPVGPGRPVVLVVEDNPDNLRTARAMLKDAFEVLEAQDGRAGFELARQNRPDLILMDIAMPVMDGVQALAEIRKDQDLRHTPVIAVTASAMVGDRETILAHGFDGYLSKPIDAALLLKTLHDALD